MMEIKALSVFTSRYLTWLGEDKENNKRHVFGGDAIRVKSPKTRNPLGLGVRVEGFGCVWEGR